MIHSSEQKLKGTEREQTLLFLVGAPRSGTKLLRHLLSRNPDVGMTTNETEFLPFLFHYAEQGGFRHPDGFERFCRYLRHEDYFAHRILEGHQATDFEAWATRCRTWLPKDIFHAFLQGEINDAQSLKVLGDKSPGYIRILNKIVEEFPSARFVHIVRDPRSQVGSLRATFGKPVIPSAWAWKASIQRVDDLCNRHSSTVFQVRYEDLTASPGPWLRQICDFLSISFDEAMLQVDRELERARPDNRPVGLRMAKEDIYETYLSDTEIAQVEAICSPEMQDLGYATTRSPISPPSQGRIMADAARAIGLGRLSFLTLKRHGPGDLIRKIRLARARGMIRRGRWS